MVDNGPGAGTSSEQATGSGIELSAIEEVLLSHEAVLEAHVNLVGDGGNGEALQAVITLKVGYPPSDELKSELAWFASADLGELPPFRSINFRTYVPEGFKTAAPVDASEGDEVNISGHVVNTADVERVLADFSGVADAKVICVPDNKRGALLKAYVKLSPGAEPTEDLKGELAWQTQINMGPMVRFKDIIFVDFLSQDLLNGGETAEPVEDLAALVRRGLMAHPWATDAAVFLQGNGSGTKDMTASVTLAEDAEPSEELKLELAWSAQAAIGKPVAFKELNFVIPHTDGGAKTTATLVVQEGEGGDVSLALMAHPDVRFASVVNRSQEDGKEVYDAYIRLKPGAAPSQDLKVELAWLVQAELTSEVKFHDIHFGEPPAGEGEVQEEEKDGMVIVDKADRDAGGYSLTSHYLSTNEVTQALMSHPDVSDAAVLTVPDDRLGEKLKAFIRLREGVEPTNDLKLELAWHVVTELKPVAVFRAVDFEPPAASGEPAQEEEADEEAINISGMTVLSTEVEDALKEHRTVTDAIVIGVPDDQHGEALKAYVTLLDGQSPTEELRNELAWTARSEVGDKVVFKFIEFRKFLPETEDRAMLRRVLKADSLDIPSRISIQVVD
jgi:acyl-coenzyme A synthetase/AMP-(fatty) acid ligase